MIPPNKKRYVLMTGMSGGLGMDTARSILDQGYNIINIGLTDFPAVIDELTAYGATKGLDVRHIEHSFGHPDLLKVKLASGTCGINPVDMHHLVLCHGINVNAPWQELSWEQIEKSMFINFGNSFILCQYLMTGWVVDKTDPAVDRSLIYISSVAAQAGSPSEIAYHSAKRAMESAMLSFAREGAQYSVRANVISPGLMDTAMGKKTAHDRPDVLNRIPLKRLTGVAEVAQAIVFLMSSPSTTGQNLFINAGRHMSV